MVEYVLVSVGAILRDYTEVKYASTEHKMLCDIADTLYNIGMSVYGTLDKEYEELAERYGREFWELVLKDMHAVDSQIDGHVAELIEDYEYLLKELNKGIDK